MGALGRARLFGPHGSIMAALALSMCLMPLTAHAEWDLWESKRDGVYAQARSTDDQSVAEVSCAAGFPRIELSLPELTARIGKKAFLEVTTDGGHEPRSYEGFVGIGGVDVDGHGGAALAAQIMQANASIELRVKQEENMFVEVAATFKAKGSTKAVGKITAGCEREFQQQKYPGPPLGTELALFKTLRFSEEPDTRLSCWDDPEATLQGSDIKVSDLYSAEELAAEVQCYLVRTATEGKQVSAPVQIAGLEMEATFVFQRFEPAGPFRLAKVLGLRFEDEQQTFDAARRRMTEVYGESQSQEDATGYPSEIWLGEVGAQVSYDSDRVFSLSYYLSDY